MPTQITEQQVRHVAKLSRLHLTDEQVTHLAGQLATILDYVGNWAGEWSDIIHSNMTFRSPALTGDLSRLDGEVVEISNDDPSGRPLAKINVSMTNQNGDELALGVADVLLPTETLPAADEFGA